MASEIKMGISLDSSGVRKGLAKAKSSVKNFTSEATASLKTFTRVGVAGLAAGFSVAARKSLSYAKEVENLSRISNTSIEDFQRNAHAAQTVGIEQEKLADIYKDTGDKIGDFLQTGGGPMVDYFENIAPLVGQTAEQFRELSGPDALQLYFDGLEKANLSQNDMTFYMEAIASDATALIPLLAKNGQAFRDLGKDATVMGDSTVAELAKAEKALDSLERKTIIVAGRIVEAFSFLFGQSDVQARIKEQEKELNEFTSGAVAQLELENKVTFSQKDRASLLDPETERGRIGAIMSDYGIEPEKEFGLASEAFFEAGIKARKLLRADKGESIADQQAQNKKAAQEKTSLVRTSDIKKAKQELADAEAQAAERSMSKEAKLFNLMGQRKELQEKITSDAKAGTKEALEQIKAKTKIIEIDQELAGLHKEITAEKKRQAKQDADTAAKKQKQFDDEVNKANEASDAAAKKVADDAKIAKEKAELEKDQSLQSRLIDAQVKQRAGLENSIKNEIALRDKAKEIQAATGKSEKESLELAKKKLQLEAGADVNLSGFVTRKEQRAFDKAQKVRAKEQKERQRQEVRDELKKKQGMTARERAEAAAQERKARREKAQIKRDEGRDNDVFGNAKGAIQKAKVMKPKKPENVIVKALDKQTELLKSIDKSLKCEG